MHFRNTTIWKEAPFIRLFIPFTAGIVAEKYLAFPVQIWVLGICVLVPAGIILSSLPLHMRFYLRPVYGLLLNAALFITGAILTSAHDIGLSDKSLSRLYQKNDVLLLTLQEPLTETRATYKTIASVSALYRKDSIIEVTGLLLLYFRRDSMSEQLKYGNELMVFSEALPILHSGNPGTFNFAAYAKLQGILMQAFVSKADFLVIQDAKANNLKAWLIDCRKAICTILKNNISGNKEYGLAEALLVGYKDDLDKDLLQAYSNTGVVHVIAISGLHLGILYIICKGILVLFPFFRINRWITSFLIIIFLWLFSLLTGGSPSVLRSAVMFTAILCGESFSRKISIYNCLAASAFILLSYNPYWLFDIGFQLSYSAVLSILVFNKAFEQLLFVKNKLLDKLWQMVTVSLAAQVLTTPVSLFYFKQFPNYFLLANLVAVPLSSAILIGEIFLCMISVVPLAPEIVGKLLTVSIRVMNSSVEHINQLPFSLISGINLTLVQVLLLYCLLISLSLYLFRKRKIFLMIAQLVLVGIACSILYRKMEIRQTQLVIVYNIKGKQVIEIVDGRKSMITGFDAACVETDCGQIINAAHTLYGITTMERTDLPDYIRGEKAAVHFINHPEDIQVTPQASTIILSPQMTAHAETICRQLRPSLIVLDASYSPKVVRFLSGIASKKHINIHAVSSKGAFVKTLN